jgi:hypothetical protein
LIAAAYHRHVTFFVIAAAYQTAFSLVIAKAPFLLIAIGV